MVSECSGKFTKSSAGPNRGTVDVACPVGMQEIYVKTTVLRPDSYGFRMLRKSEKKASPEPNRRVVHAAFP